MLIHNLLATVLLLALEVASATAQVRLLVTRPSPSEFVGLLNDANGNGVIDAPSEVASYVSQSVVPGAFVSPLSLAASRDRFVLIGTSAGLVAAHDDNLDGDANDAGEFTTFIPQVGPVFHQPVGVLGRGFAVVMRTEVWRPFELRLAQDFNGDNAAEEQGEFTPILAFGQGGSGQFRSYALRPDDVLILGTGLKVSRVRDFDGDGLIASNEMRVVFDESNASGTGGFSPSALIIAGGQASVVYLIAPPSRVVRLRDLNQDGDYQDSSEADVVFDTGDLTSVLSEGVILDDGSLIVSNAQTRRLLRLRDANHDGDFLDLGESVTFFQGPTAASVSRFAPFSRRCNVADIASVGGEPLADGATTVDDLVAFVTAFSATEGCGLPPCGPADVAEVGGTSLPDGQLTVDDLVAFVNAFVAGR